MSPNAHGEHVRKVCGCGWRRWPKCPHPWYFSYKPRGGARYRFSFDAEFGGHLEGKLDAEKKAAEIRAAIDAGTFERVADRRLREQREATRRAQVADHGVTLDRFAPLYIERAARASGKRSWTNDVGMFARLRAYCASDGRRLGEWLLSRITEDTIEAFFSTLSALSASTRNQYVQLLKASFRWAAKKGYLLKSPLSEESTLKRTKVAQRRRRLLPDEEQAVLEAAGRLIRGAGPRLQWIIIAAIETGCRLGELLAVRWVDVDLTKRTLLVRATEVGAGKVQNRSRLLPVSARLAAVLDMARLDPAGRQYPPSAYVFGALGVRLKTVKKAWETVVLKSHGHEPAWVRGALSAASRAALAAVDLHFHDLRHEAGCRWL